LPKRDAIEAMKRIEPCRRRNMPGSTARVSAWEPSTWVLSTSRNSASLVAKAGFFKWIPALLTRIVIGPNCASALAIALTTSLDLVTSQTTEPACDPMAAAASRSTAARRPARTTLAPAEAMHRAIAKPDLKGDGEGQSV